MANIFSKTKNYIFAHKIISGIVLIVIIFGGYKVYAATHTTVGQTSYVLGTVQKGIIISSVSESGEVSATNQVSIQAQASGELTWVGVKPGDTVYAGQAIASIDNTTAKQSVADAQAALSQAQLQLQQDQAQAPITYQSTLNNLATDQANLATEYNNVFDALSTTYLDLPNIVNGMQDILDGYDLNSSKSQANEDVLANLFGNIPGVSVASFETTANTNYDTAQASYAPALAAYQQINRDSATSTMEAVLAQSIQTTTNVAQALQSELDFLGQITNLGTQYDIKVPSGETTLQNTARTDLTTANNDLNSLLAEQKTLLNDKNTIITDQQNISIQQIGNDSTGDDPISLQISESNIAKQEVDLANLKQDLADYTVVAPFDGTISAVTAVVGSNAGTIATIVSPQQIATLSLNEVDVAKIALGDKVTLTFDAIDGLSMAGTVAEIDPVGTVSQGVVSYNVQVSFDTQNSQVKPGMTVNADIQTAVHQDALYVPSGAVKTTGGMSYVQAFTPPLANAGGTTGVVSITPPQQILVTTGISNDTDVEILSGLTEGQQIVTRTTVSTTAAKTTTATPSATSLLGGGAAAGGGAGFRAGGTTGGAAAFGR